MNISLIELSDVVTECQKASTDIHSILEKLGEKMDALNESWSELSEQGFYQLYTEWQTEISGLPFVLEMIATQLQEIIERFEEAEK